MKPTYRFPRKLPFLLNAIESRIDSVGEKFFSLSFNRNCVGFIAPERVTAAGLAGTVNGTEERPNASHRKLDSLQLACRARVDTLIMDNMLHNFDYITQHYMYIYIEMGAYRFK